MQNVAKLTATGTDTSAALPRAPESVLIPVPMLYKLAQPAQQASFSLPASCLLSCLYKPLFCNLQKSEREKPHSGKTNSHSPTETPCNQPAIAILTQSHPVVTKE